LGVYDPQQMAITNFIQPILRCIRYSTIGIPIELFDNNIQPIQSSITHQTTPTITQYINLPSYLTSTFTSWNTSQLPWLQKFTTLLPPLLNITSTEIHSSTYLYDPESNPFSILESTLQQFRLDNYHNILSSQTPELQTIEPSLCSPFSSLALTSLPLTYAAY
jgi:hypothetical protein